MEQTKPRKKLPLWAKILIPIGGVLVLAVLFVLIMGLRLYGRLSRPEPEPVPTPAVTAAPQATPAPTPEPRSAVVPVSEPEPEPEPEPLPLSDLLPQTRLSEEQLARLEAEAADTEHFTHVLLVGVDRRNHNSQSYLTDVMIIATIDRAHDRLKLSSLLRDLYVPYANEQGQGRLNAAVGHGGIPELLATINQDLHLQLSQYAMVDFSMFEQIVDEMDGVTLSLTAAEISAANDCIAGLNKQLGVEDFREGFIYAAPGNIHLTGKQALGYARIRKIDSDFQRTHRQFEVLRAVYARFRQMKITRQYALLYDMLPYVETNMDLGFLVDTILSALQIQTNGLLHFSLPVQGQYESMRVSGSAVLVPDLPANALSLHDFIFLNADEPKKAQVLQADPLPAPTPTPAPVPEELPPEQRPFGGLLDNVPVEFTE